VLELDLATLTFSYLLPPAALPGHRFKYRMGETPDGRLCVVTVENELMQRWVRDDSMRSDNGWIVEEEMDISKVYDMVPGLPKDRIRRKQSIMVMDVDVGQKWKLFIEMLGYGTFSFDSKTRKLHRLATKGGKEYGKPISAYFLAWPPAFLAQA
jgi:hypothetical protein